MSGSLLFQCFRKQSTASWIDQVTACASEHGGIFRPSEFLHGELAAEPVPELRKALNLHEDEFVVLTKACYGLIDAPRRWWKSLVPDTQQLGWRSCRHVPCLMTWHVRGRLKGLMCFHVDDVMISGPRDDPEFKRMMEKVKLLYEWGEWEQHKLNQCGLQNTRSNRQVRHS